MRFCLQIPQRADSRSESAFVFVGAAVCHWLFEGAAGWDCILRNDGVLSGLCLIKQAGHFFFILQGQFFNFLFNLFGII